jgi:hypothetical protein
MTQGGTIHLGFEVGTGEQVAIPLAHTFVCGQTQQSGKTTALQAIVDRSGRKALAFVTKRGEQLDGRAIRPYLPREGDQPIHWRMVEVILASSVDQKGLKYERLWIINASKGARSLDDVQANVRRLRDKTKNEKAKDIYTLLDEYLELVLPQMRSLHASDVLDLQPGLNVMDLSGIGAQTQAMVIRAALERINHHETGVLTLLPEAWEFAPRDRSAPAKFEAEAMARKGAAPKVQNFLLCDSQDIAGVHPVIRQASSVWLLGVQRELNELKRAVQMMPAGVKRPKADDVATLGLGQFYVCYGDKAIKTYVQPAWMEANTAREIAMGRQSAADAVRFGQAFERLGRGAEPMRSDLVVDESTGKMRRFRGAEEEPIVTKTEADRLERENEALKGQVADLREQMDELRRQYGLKPPAVNEPARASAPMPSAATPFANFEELYHAIKVRLKADAPALLKLVDARPEIEVAVERRVITADGASTIGRIARLLKSGFLEDSKRFSEILKELERTGTRINNKSQSVALQELVIAGFVTKESVDRYRAVPGMTVRIVEA